MADIMKDDIDAHLMHKLKEIVPEVTKFIYSYAEKQKIVYAIDYSRNLPEPNNKREKNSMNTTNNRLKRKQRRIILLSNKIYLGQQRSFMNLSIHLAIISLKDSHKNKKNNSSMIQCRKY